MNNLLVDPGLLFQKAQLQRGMYVADFGADQSGHIVFPAALLLGEKGLVYAVNILKSILENIKKRADLESMTNIHPIWSDLEKGKTAIPGKSLDVVFIVNTLSFCSRPDLILQEAKRLLREKSRLLIVDWKTKMNSAMGPKDDNFVDFKKIKDWAKAEGFLVQEEFAVGKYHHGLVLFRHE
ncbi:MAG: hypothetical protein A3B90_02990 [Candidatus Magasanikbacteria bacterium RIFCSPHIGHO2_02_FULL_41_13]|uniref:Methyltransferase domain-containing protein n=1 Tax=Candidatus Magasanikbacteria bacterium RIFCSPHIGHO2_02_FULL_41_13 TaxID=1798676 RepID=A0A1F6M303_9BACT|nr:MAG: hypothetical protein A3B90_02990 [Candidatus Magasanikbacteria bacterium RIFCSPHIGHO2_02_FULL_41_13]